MIEFRLPDMTCAHCAHTVSQVLELADPGRRVQIDLATRTTSPRSSACAAACVRTRWSRA
jgi:copper chaperone